MTTDLSERPRNPETLAGYGVFSSGICVLEGTLTPARGGVIPATLPVCAAHPRAGVSVLQGSTACNPLSFSHGFSRASQSTQAECAGHTNTKSPWMLVRPLACLQGLPGSAYCTWNSQPALPLRGSPRSMLVCLSCGDDWRLTDCQGPLRLLAVCW